MNNQLLSIKAKKFGVRLAGFRQRKGVSTEVLSKWIGISQDELEKIEFGESTISLPLIELIAFKLGLMTDTLLNGKIESEVEASQEVLFNQQFSALRDRMIALNLRKARTEQGLSVPEVAEKCGITEEQLEQYETGNASIPWPTLECLSEIFQLPIGSLISNITPAGVAQKTENAPSTGSVQFSEELDKFINNSANLPYLELAKRLSELDAAKLRSIAEGLLEITY